MFQVVGGSNFGFALLSGETISAPRGGGSDNAALSQYVWAHQSGEPGLFPAPHLMYLSRGPSFATCKNSLTVNSSEAELGITGVVCRCEASVLRVGHIGWVVAGALYAMEMVEVELAYYPDPLGILLLGNFKHGVHLLLCRNSLLLV